MDSTDGQRDAFASTAGRPSADTMLPGWQDPFVDPRASRPSREETPCKSRAKRHHDRERVGEAAILPGDCLQRPEQMLGAKKWLVQVLARRGVEIVRAKQGEQR